MGGARLTGVGAAMQEKLGLPENEGLLAAAVDANSPAEKAGLKVNDVLVKINNKPVPSDNLDVFVKLVQEQNPDTGVDLVVIRDGKEETLKGSKMPASVQSNQIGRGGVGRIIIGRGGMGGLGGMAGAIRGLRINPNIQNPNPINPLQRQQGKIQNLQLQMTIDGAKVSRKQTGDDFSGEYSKDDLKITMTGKFENGGAKAKEIVVQEGKDTKKYTNLAEVPAQHRQLIHQYLAPTSSNSIRVTPLQQGMPMLPNLPGFDGIPGFDPF